MRYRYLFFFIVLIAFEFESWANNFLHAEGKIIVNGKGENVLLRGMGLGGWMLQEGYMLETAEFAGAQHEIKAAITDLAGLEGMEAFYDKWLTNYCTKTDIDSLTSWGFNSIRLPMHYNLFTLPIEDEPVKGVDTWLDRGFEMVDDLLDWCSANEIYLILDLHAAPGGQGKDANISDYDPSKRSLWESVENQRKTVALWKRLAERYANEPWIGGYDLINEPNWDIDNAGNKNGCNCNQNTQLWSLYKQIINEIRKVDSNHMIIIEGNCWGNNYNGLPKLSTIDNNLVLSFHKYWSHNNQSSIEGIMNLSKTQNVPIWLGESGENSNTWFTNAINLVEGNNIGWAWWPYKKISSVTGTVTIPKTEGYQKLLNYWKNGGVKPSVKDATAWLIEQAEMLKLENCTIHADVIDAMFRQAQGDKSTIPFKNHKLPGTIFATDYDLGANEYAFYDVDSADYHVSTNNYTAWNTGYAYRNDAVDIEACYDVVTNGFSVGWTNTGEWLIYTVRIDSSAAYTLDLRYAANSSAGKFHLELDGLNVTNIQTLPSTGGWTKWKNFTLENIVLKKGIHKLKFYIDQSGFNINYLKFYDIKPMGSVNPEIINLKTDPSGNYIKMVSNLGYGIESQVKVSDFALSINNQNNSISSVSFDTVNNNVLIIELDEAVINANRIRLSFSGNELYSPFNTKYLPFSDKEVQNVAPNYIVLPAKIQAEDFSINNGMVVETCTDTGGGYNIAYANPGDYVDYQVYLFDEGQYKIDYRVAGLTSGKFEMQLMVDDTEKKLHQITVSTGGWQIWQTMSAYATLPSGKFIIRLYVVSGEFNLNWFRITFSTKVNNFDAENDRLIISCLTDNSIKVIKKSNSIDKAQLFCFDLQGKKIFNEEVDFKGNSSVLLSKKIHLKGLYIFHLKTNEGFCTQKLWVY